VVVRRERFRRVDIDRLEFVFIAEPISGVVLLARLGEGHVLDQQGLEQFPAIVLEDVLDTVPRSEFLVASACPEEFFKDRMVGMRRRDTGPLGS